MHRGSDRRDVVERAGSPERRERLQSTRRPGDPSMAGGCAPSRTGEPSRVAARGLRHLQGYLGGGVECPDPSAVADFDHRDAFVEVQPASLRRTGHPGDRLVTRPQGDGVVHGGRPDLRVGTRADGEQALPPEGVEGGPYGVAAHPVRVGEDSLARQRHAGREASAVDLLVNQVGDVVGERTLATPVDPHATIIGPYGYTAKPPESSMWRVSVTASSIRRSWVTRSSVPGYRSSADSSCSIAGRSRWLVGSSSTNRLTPRACRRASAARVRSPGERLADGRRTWSARSPNLASTVRTSPGTKSGTAAPNASTSGAGPVNSPRAWSISPTTTPGPRYAEPADSGRRPSRAPSSVDLPAPLAPVIATRSAQSTCRSIGPSVNGPRWTTAPRSAATTVPARGAAAISIRSSHSLRGSSTTSSRSMSRSVWRALAACFSVASIRALRPSLSPSV